LGLVFVHKRHQQVEEAFRGFLFQDYGLRQQAVARAVAGRISLALVGDGASRAGSVCS
jgi:hypothetical protein